MTALYLDFDVGVLKSLIPKLPIGAGTTIIALGPRSVEDFYERLDGGLYEVWNMTWRPPIPKNQIRIIFYIIFGNNPMMGQEILKDMREAFGFWDGKKHFDMHPLTIVPNEP